MIDRSALPGILLLAVFVGVLADLMTPYGPVALTLGLGFLAAAIVAGLGSLAAPLRNALRPAAAIAGVHAAVLAALIGLWYVAPKPAAIDRGVIVALAPALASLQDALVAKPHPGRPHD